jgi:hypothetical protein
MDENQTSPDDPWYLPNPLDICPPLLRRFTTPKEWELGVKDMLADWAQIDAEERKRRRLKKTRKRPGGA